MNDYSKRYSDDYLKDDNQFSGIVRKLAKTILRDFSKNLPDAFEKMMQKTGHTFASSDSPKKKYY